MDQLHNLSEKLQHGHSGNESPIRLVLDGNHSHSGRKALDKDRKRLSTSLPVWSGYIGSMTMWKPANPPSQADSGI